MNLNQITGKNIKWSFIEGISLKLVSFILSIILARLLTPSDFGVLAIVNVFYLLTVLFIDGGLKEALIQKKQATDNDYSTMFWLNIGMSLILYLLLFSLAPFIENYYEYHNLSFFIRLQSVTLIIESFGLIQIVKATRDLDIKKITTARIPASILSFFVGITMAYLNFGVLSLIVQQIANAIFYTLILSWTVRYSPRWALAKKSVKELYSFGLKIVVITFLSRLYVQSLNLIFASYYNPQLLGLYTKSKSLQGAPIEVVNSAFAKGLYPTMVKVQEHNRLLRKIFLSNFRRLSLFMAFVNGFLFFNAKEITVFLLGEQWMQMGVYLKIAAVGSLLFPVNGQVINTFKAKGLAGRVLKIELISKSISLILIFVLSGSKSFPTVLWSIAFINIGVGLVFLYYCSALIFFSFKKEFFKLLTLVLFHALWGYSLLLAVESFLHLSGIIRTLVFFFFYTIGTILWSFLYKDYGLKKIIWNKN